MIDLYLPATVRDADARTIAGGTSSGVLMERAAGHLARAIVDVAGHGYGLRVAVLCGKGNNGGDGVAAARRLRAMGAHAVVHLVSGADGLSEDGAAQLARWRGLDGRESATVETALASADVAVDCLLGTGATGAPRGAYADAVEALRAFDGPVVACDVPTGVDAASGAVPGAAVSATATVVLGLHKRGLWLAPGSAHAGRLVFADIGLGAHAPGEPVARVLEDADAAALVAPTGVGADKRTRGTVAAWAGSAGMSGAARLVAGAASAGGAGLVTVVTDADARLEVAVSAPEVLTTALPDDPDAAYDVIAKQAARTAALAVGPGLGLAADTQALVRRVVREIDIPLVLDADGLNAFRDRGEELSEHASPLLVLTPHARELARLTGGQDGWGRRADLVGELAARWSAVIVAKGPGSLIAAPDGRVWVDAAGTAALATGGTGDVLTGLTAALIAARPDPRSVAAAVHLHGLAGVAAGRATHPRAVRAPDVVAGLPAALHALDAAR